MMKNDDYATIRELTKKHRGRKVLFCRYIDGKWTGYDLEGIVSHFTSLRTISVEYENELRNAHDEKFKFID